MATLAHNLFVRRTAVLHCWPTVSVFWLGDAAHQAERSDHNPDSRGIVHAIDVMLQAGSARAIATLKWLLSHPADLQYVIHNRKIYHVKNGFSPVAYTGSDPHTNHIHASGRHGTVGGNAHTESGYSTAAEKISPTGTPCDPEDEVVSKEDVAAIAKASAAAVVAQKLGRSGPVVGVALQSRISADAAAKVIASPEFQKLLADVAELKARP